MSETTYHATGAVKATYLPLADGNGNITGLIDKATGTVVVTYSYSAFGQCTSSAWMGTQDSSDPNPFRFSTHYQDENGLIYMGMRFYKADWGRFINRDPSGESGGANLFAYCGNDPINNVDPLGLDDTISTDYQKGLSQVATSSKYPWYLVTSAKYNVVSILVHTVFVDSTAMTSRGIRQAFPQAQAALTAQESTLSPDDTIGHLAISAGRVFTKGSEPITYGSFLLSEAGKFGAAAPVAELRYVKPVVTFLKPTVPYVASGFAALQTAHVVAMPSNQRQIEDYMDLGALFGAAWMANGAVSRSENIGSISEMEAAVRGESRGILQLGMNGGSKNVSVPPTFQLPTFSAAASEGLISGEAHMPVTGSQWYEAFAGNYGAENVGWSRLPAYTGGKTSGLLATSVGDIDLLSGYAGPSAAMAPGQVPGMNYILQAHVEAHAASAMRQLGLNEATLYLNQTPCIWTNGGGCNAMLSRMLGEGTQLRVVVPGQMDQVFVGVGR